MSRRDTLRWSGSLAVVVGVHAGAVAGMLAWTANSAPPAPPPAAVVIELAPLVQAPEPPPEPPPEEMPPEPEPPPPEPEPEPPPPEPEPEPVIEEPPPVVEPPVPLPPKKVERKPPPPPKPVAAKPPPPVAPPPPPVQAPPAQQAAAPRIDKAVVSRPNAVPTWQGTLLAHLERHKRYPRAAQARRQEGVVKVAFTLDRRGNVLAAALRDTSGHRLLDAEALEMLRRAAPLPPPPPEVDGDTVELVVPVQFFMK